MSESFYNLTSLLFACSYNGDMYRADFDADKGRVTVYNCYKVVFTIEDSSLNIDQLSRAAINKIFLSGLVSIEAELKIKQLTG
jgi:hypothetical protein